MFIGKQGNLPCQVILGIQNDLNGEVTALANIFCFNRNNICIMNGDLNRKVVLLSK